MSSLIDHSHVAAFDDESLLVDRAARGDEGAFRALYNRYYNRVYSIAKGILLQGEEAEDAVQEIFTLAYRNLGRFDRRSRFSTWLFRIAVNRSIQQSRSLKFKRGTVPLGDEAETIADRTDASPAEDPKVASAMERLQPGDRAVLTLFYWDELSLNEVAESIGCSPNAAKTRLFRARERFKQFFEQEAGE
ncbi:MAG: sigma-70 family RNA polymerase sigma factor [Armatimonadetes bacterium]|nr:sigma-70 family RNA polymerase sigma factor [Armatimonadota bacterium]